jgi:tetratricopeptide (TPR) repeat protein
VPPSAHHRPIPPGKIARLVGDVLRHLDHPIRIAQNELTQHYFDGHSSGRTSDTERQALSHVRAAVEAALERLSPRQRTIVERCDLHHELHASVIRDLAISERYFYRERSVALRLIGDYLSAEQPLARQHVLVNAPPLEAALTRASSLAQTGYIDDAMAYLDRLAAEAIDVPSKIAAFCRLIEVAAYGGLPVEASRHGASAVRLLGDVAEERALLEAQVRAVTAFALYKDGRDAIAESLAARARHVLLAHESITPGQIRVVEALTAASFVLADQALARADITASVAISGQAAHHVNRLRRQTPLLRIRAAFCQTIMRSYGEVGEADAAALALLVEESLDCGLTADALRIASSLAGAYRQLGRPRDAIQTLSPLLSLYVEVSPPEDEAIALIQLAAAYIAVDAAHLALPLLEKARLARPSDVPIQTVSYVHQVHAHLALHDGLAALRASHAAIERSAAQQRPAQLGAALRCQALALEAIGDRRAARSSMDRSVRLLREGGQPALADRAHYEAERISGRSGPPKSKVTRAPSRR